MSIAATILAGAVLSSAASAQILNHGSSKPGSEEAAVRIDPAAARAAFLTANPGAGIYEDEPVRGGRVSRVYGPAFSHGVNPVDSAERFLVEHADIFSS
ncbi:MAG: hypothetical protein RLY21_2364, partial [Planctomycetota bacterium]